jgi:hypothetical protein
MIPLMMEAEMVSETLGFYPQLTRLVAREDFIEFSRRESFKSYILKELIPELIPSQKCHTNMGPIFNGYGAMDRFKVI